MRVTGSVRVRRRMPTWATEARTAEASPTSAAGSKTPVPGRRISSRPANPSASTPHSRGGIRSPSQARSTSGMKSGIDWLRSTASARRRRAIA